MRVNWKSCLIICATVFLLYLAIIYWSNITGFLGVVAASASTLLIGAAIAYVVNILMGLFERHIAPKSQNRIWLKAKRPVCMLLSFLTLAVVIVLLVQLIVPQLFKCFDNLVSALGKAVPELYAWLDERFSISEYLKEKNLPTDIASINWRSLLEEYAHVLLTGFGGVMNVAVTVTTEVIGMIVSLFLSIIFACNILAGKEQLGAQFSALFCRLLGEDTMKKVRHVLSVLDDCFHCYIVGQLTEAVILGGLCALGMAIFNIGREYALMIGTLIGVTALIPIAGAYIGAGVGAIVLFSVSPLQAVAFLVFILILQQVEGNVIYPHTVGSSLHLPGLWVLAAVSIGGGVMGIAGMLLFVPLTAAAYRLTGEWVRHEGQPSLAERITTFGSDEAPPAPNAASPAVAVASGDHPVPQPAPAAKHNKRRRR